MKPREPSRRHARCDLDAVCILDPNDEHALNVRPAVMPLSSSAPTVTPKTPITICALYVHLRSPFTDMNDRHDRLFDGYRLEVQVSMPMSFQSSTPNVICSGRRTLPLPNGATTKAEATLARATAPAALVAAGTTETATIVIATTGTATVIVAAVPRLLPLAAARRALLFVAAAHPPTAVATTATATVPRQFPLESPRTPRSASTTAGCATRPSTGMSRRPLHALPL